MKKSPTIQYWNKRQSEKRDIAEGNENRKDDAGKKRKRDNKKSESEKETNMIKDQKMKYIGE
jgi:hypothetical protein